MIPKLYKALLFVISILLTSPTVFSQITSSSNNTNNASSDRRSNEQTASEALLLTESGLVFKEGLSAYNGDDRKLSGDKFNKAIEMFLYSTIGVQNSEKSRYCYNQLIENIYILEFPSETLFPRLAELSNTCGWNLGEDLIANTVKAFRIGLDRSLRNKSTLSVVGFNRQEFEPSPSDELIKLDYKAGQGGLSGSQQLLTVKAKAGETVESLARRHGANVDEVAKLNGLLPNSVLGAGREVKLLSKDIKRPVVTGPLTANGEISPRSKENRIFDEKKLSPATKPLKDNNGRYFAVMKYFDEYLHDPYSMKIVRWSPLTASTFMGEACWRVSVRYRAKNKLGAYVLSERVFLIRNNRVISSLEID